MLKSIIGILLLFVLANYEGVDTYKDVETLSHLGSLMNTYITSMTAVILIAFGIDEIKR